MLHYSNERSNSNNQPYRPTTTVLKAFEILEFISTHQPAKPAQITERLGLSRTNVHRLLATLMRIGYVMRDGQKGYRLTFKMFQLGSRVPLGQDLREVAKPIMINLMKQVSETVYLSVLHQHTVVSMEEVKSPHPLSPNPEVTYSYPVHACASGKNFLSLMDADVRDRLLNETKMEQLSPKTITDRETLLRELEVVRESGYATEFGEFSEDLNSVSAPIFDYRGEMVACISISGPSIRALEEKMLKYVPVLLDAAATISKELGRAEEH